MACTADTILGRLERRSVRRGACRIWQGATTRDGYGQISIDGKLRYVHRVSYAIHNGHDAAGDVDHKLHCDHRCWEPSHLQDLPAKQNRQDGARHRWRLVAELKRMERVIAHLSIEVG